MKVMSFTEIKDINEFVYNFLSTSDLKRLSLGRHDFSNGIYCNVEEYETTPRRLYEAHKKYIDIQIVVSGKEKIVVKDINELKAFNEYNPEKDFISYENDNLGNEYILKENDCLVLYPQDGHMPKVMIDEPVHVKKIVFKIPV